jgi:hypothetical protein
MASIVLGDLDAMMQLRVGLVTSSNKYTSEANLVRAAANRLAGASDTNSHDLIAEEAEALAARLETLGEAFDVVADGLTPEIERLSALVDLTRRPI